jgi:anti-anti-sigma factor
MFEYTMTREASCPCIKAKGRIDALSASELQKVFQQLILAGERVLLADLSGIHYISSAGLRVFITAQKELKKVGGEMLLAGLTPQVFEVFKISGVDQLFRMASGAGGIGVQTRATQETFPGHRVRTHQISMAYIEKDAPPGSLFLIGSTDKMENAAYTEADVVPVGTSRMRSGCGLAALGESFDDYQNLFGEAMVVNGNFFYYPAVRHPSVDFMLNAHADPDATYKFLHGFAVNGDYRYLLSFKSENGASDLTNLVHAFLSVSRTNLVGITILAESKGIWGMNIRKPPFSNRQTARRESVFSNRSFPDWFDFPVEPAYTSAVVAATGIAARNPRELPGALQHLFSGDNLFHLHGGLFGKAPISNNISDFDGELARIFNELDVFKIQHLLGQSRFAGGMAGLVEIEV